MLEKVEEFLLEYERMQKVPITLHTCTNADDLLCSLKKTDFDLLILDIIMPGFTGMQAAHEIRKFNEEIKIIFLTSSRESAIESYVADAYYYLLKPVSEAMYDSKRTLLLPGSLPVFYFIFDYATTVYTRILYAGNIAISEFIPTITILFYVVFAAMYRRELEKDILPSWKIPCLQWN